MRSDRLAKLSNIIDIVLFPSVVGRKFGYVFYSLMPSEKKRNRGRKDTEFTHGQYI
jgi:hypothetical protein